MTEINSYVATINPKEDYVERPDHFNSSAEILKNMNGVSPSMKRRATQEIQKRLQGKDGVTSTHLETESANIYDIFKVARPPYNQIYLATLYEQSGYQYSAVNAKVSNIVGLGYRFEESTKMKHKMQDAKDEKKLVNMRKRLAVLKDDLEEFLNSLNEEELFIETLKRVYTDYQTMGNGYLEIGRNRNGTIGYIGHVPAAYVRVRIPRDGFVQIIGRDAVFFRNFGDKEMPDPIGNQTQPNEIIHFRNYSPSSTYYGVPDIVAASSAVAGNEYATRFNLDFFEYRAAPRYLIVSKGAKLSDRSEQRLLEFFQEGLKGKNHRSVYVPLPADDLNFKNELEIKPIENGIQDASFEKYRTMNRDEILYANRVPITKLGMAQGISISAAKDLNQTFSEQVCTPEKRNLEKKINKIISEITDAVVIRFNELTLTDEAAQSKIDEVYLRMKTFTPNEVRLRMGLEPIEDGDKVIELKPEQAAEQRAQANGNRKRDQQRSQNATDTMGATNTRSAQGEGRQQS